MSLSRRLFPILLFLCASAFADRLKVTVVDPQSAVAAGARVALYAASDHAVAVVTTSAEGIASFDRLTPGEYQVEVLAPGFAPNRKTVSVSGDSTVKLALTIAVANERVEVTAARTPTSAAETASTVETLDREQLRLFRPLSAADALRLLPGAVVAPTGQRGSLTSLFVRGGESRYNKVLIDGVPVNDSDSFFNFGVISMFDVDRVEFMRGADSALYGSDAMTSVIRLESAPGRTPEPELLFGAEGGTFSTARGFASIAGVRGRADYRLFGEQTNTEGADINNDYSNAAQGANVGFSLRPNVRLRLRARHSNNRSGVSSAWNFNGARLLSPDEDQVARQNDLLASVDVEIDAPARWQHRLRGFEYSHKLFNQDLIADRGCDFLLGIFFDCPFKTLSKFNRAGLEYQGEYTPRSWARTVFGYVFEDEHGDLRDLLFGGTTPGLRRSHGLYVEQLLVGGRGSLVAGVRYVHNENFGNKAVPRIAGVLALARGAKVLSGTRLRFAFSEGIKAPDFLESFGNAGFLILPNPNLKPEQNLSVEAGVEQNLAHRWSVSATYFRNSFRDRIDFKFLGPPTFESIFVNLNKALAHGAELELHGRVRALTVQGAYFYTSTKVLEAPLNPASVGRPLLRRPRHSGLLQFMYVKHRWAASVTGSFVGPRPDSDFLGFGIDHTAGYARVDLGGWYTVRRNVTAYVNIENALDKKYNDVVGYPALGISVRAGLQFRVGGK
jgi:vitamin B12 transporter